MTFQTMAYIILQNPIKLAGVPDVDGNILGGGSEPGSGFTTIAACTALVAGRKRVPRPATGNTAVWILLIRSPR